MKKKKIRNSKIQKRNARHELRKEEEGWKTEAGRGTGGDGGGGCGGGRGGRRGVGGRKRRRRRRRRRTKKEM
jgi:hypothetical protein